MARYAFKPDYTIAPGATLRETIEQQGMSQAELAQRTGLAQKTVSQIINGIAPISFETSEKLEMATGVPSSFWNRRELSHREALAKREELVRFESEVNWLKQVPVKELVNRGVVEPTEDKPELVRRMLKFFGVSSVSSWRETWLMPAAQYRGGKSQEKHPGYVAAWLRLGELQAGSIACEPFDRDAFRRCLSDIRSLTQLPVTDWQSRLSKTCAKAGVVVAITREVPRAALSGAARWLTKERALIQLSLKYKTDDQFWFTFFHEAGHILLHGKRQVFLEYGNRSDTEIEREANAFARDWLIPPDFVRDLPYLKSKASIKTFAKEIGISPGVVVGRLQYDKVLPPSHCNDLKLKCEWK
jgi:Zn-dependent peptidase ImmA (M78 family)/transcriptional regulator with XRE-family HTH domain